MDVKAANNTKLSKHFWKLTRLQPWGEVDHGQDYITTGKKCSVCFK